MVCKHVKDRENSFQFAFRPEIPFLGLDLSVRVHTWKMVSVKSHDFSRPLVEKCVVGQEPIFQCVNWFLQQ